MQNQVRQTKQQERERKTVKTDLGFLPVPREKGELKDVPKPPLLLPNEKLPVKREFFCCLISILNYEIGWIKKYYQVAVRVGYVEWRELHPLGPFEVLWTLQLLLMGLPLFKKKEILSQINPQKPKYYIKG